METIEEINDNFDVKKPKKKGLLISVIVVIALVIALIATYLLIFTKPQFIFSKAIDKIFGAKKEVTESIKLDYKIKASVDTNNEEIEEIAKELEKCSLNCATQLDVNSKQEIVDLALYYNGEEEIKAQYYCDNENMYIYLNELFDKYIEIDIPEETKESLEEVFEMIEPEQQKKSIKIQEIIKGEIKNQIKEEGEFEKAKETIKVGDKEKKVSKYTLNLSQEALIDIMYNMLLNLSENEEFLEYFEDDTFKSELKDAAKTLEENKKEIDEEIINVKINLYTEGLIQKFVGGDIETNITVNSQNMKVIFNIMKEDKDKYSYKMKMNSMGVNIEVISGIVEIQKEKDTKKEQKGTMIFTLKVAMAQLEAKLEIDYLAEYNKGIDKIDVSNSINMENLTEKDIDSITTKLMTRPLICKFLTSMNGGLFEQAQTAAEETKKAQIHEAIVLVQSDLLADYYEGLITLDEITEEKVKELLEDNLSEKFNHVKVTKIPGKLEFTITVDGIENKMNLEYLSNVDKIANEDEEIEFENKEQITIETRIQTQMSNEMKKNSSKEAVALAKADILSEYYSGFISKEQITEEYFKELVEDYLDESYDVSVTKDGEGLQFTIIVKEVEE